MAGYKHIYLGDKHESPELDEFIDNLDVGDIVHCQFNSDLTSVSFIYLKEVKRFNRHEYDSQIPEEVQHSPELSIGTHTQYKFPTPSGKPVDFPADITYLPGEELPHEEMKPEITNQNNNQQME